MEKVKLFRFFHFTISLLVFATCNKANESNYTINSDSTILIFDVSRYSRKEIAEVINSACDYNPKIIAINLVFDSLLNQEIDSILVKGLGSCRTILSAGIDRSGKIYSSNKIFTGSSANEGIISFIMDKEGLVTEYIPLYEDSLKQMLSFPVMIAMEYLGAEHFNIDDYEINKSVKINSVVSDKELIIIDSLELLSNSIRGKIIIMDEINSPICTANAKILTKILKEKTK